MTIAEETENEKDHNKDVQENVQIEEEERKYLSTYIQEMQERLLFKSETRVANQNAQNNRPGESYFTKLDSNLKKNTTFVKKIRNFTGTLIDTYIKDMSGLNLSKYISEIAAAIVDAKLKMTDVAPAIKLCSILNQTYSDFSQHLFENWQKTLSLKIGDKIANASKLRVDLRFYAELVNVGLFNNKTAFTLLGNVITTLINMDKEEHLNINIILSFCRHCGEDYAGNCIRRIVTMLL